MELMNMYPFEENVQVSSSDGTFPQGTCEHA